MNKIRKNTSGSFQEASARQRIESFLDPGSFVEICPPTERLSSPHLEHFAIPCSFDDGVIIGEGELGSYNIALAAQEGRFMGGAIGEVHSAKIVGILKRCLQKKLSAMVFLLDSGGVRLQEANAGELGVSEIIRAILDLRAAKIPVFAVVGGSSGAFGGASIISACCDYLIVSEEARIGVSGPEVIETNMGVETFDSRDRALVWRTYGGKNRFLQKQANLLLENSAADFRTAVIGLLSVPTNYSLQSLEDELQLLEERAERFTDCQDALEVWRKLGITEAEKVPELSADELKKLTQQ